jgi:hypothetical protein
MDSRRRTSTGVGIRTNVDRLGEQLATLVTRLTERDRKLCRLVAEYRVFTTSQLAELYFTSLDRAEDRLKTLTELGVVDRFRPRLDRGEGSAPYHYVLGPAGAALLAAEQGIELKELGWRRDKTLAIAHSQRLAHTLGVNGFFAALVGYARRHPRLQAHLAVWWSERRCRDRWGHVVRPDGYGRWHQQDARVDFFLEFDTGSEPTERVAGKLNGYEDLARATDIVTPLLLWLPTSGREATIRQALGRPHLDVRVATATAALGRNPAGQAWLPLGHTWPRRRLVDLADPGNWSIRPAFEVGL